MNQERQPQTDTSKYEDNEIDLMMKDCEDKLDEVEGELMRVR